ncbi:MAG: PfkB family carbohydrate kinase [Treponemataceae bacterium]|nr:PfkB family carbohydrate kinase [Treponemataceae bacterium]
MFLTLCLNPTIQKSLCFQKFELGQVNRASQSFTDVSGKGINVSRVLAQLKKPVLHVTQLALEDENYFRTNLKNQNISLCSILTSARARTCTTIIDESCQNNAKRLITELVENGNKVDSETEIRLKKAFDDILNGSFQAENQFEKDKKIEALIISGSKAPGFNDSLFADFALKAHAKNILTVLDIRGRDLIELLKCLESNRINSLEVPMIIKPNVQELKETFAKQDADFSIKQINDLLLMLFEKYGICSVITRGELSILAFDGKTFYDVPAVNVAPQDIVNTIGCGDSFTAGFAAALADGKGFESAIKAGAECGALNARTVRPGCIF